MSAKEFQELVNDTLQEQQLQLLKNPKLLDLIDEELAKLVEGEKAARLTIFLNACGKFVENCQIASYNLCINDESGAGKDFITKNVLKLFPENCVQARSRISPTVFTYWHNAKFEPSWTWDGQICYLSDISNNILNHPVFKVMCSDGSYSTIVIDNKAIDIQIKGKPVMFITMAASTPNNEMLRRFPILNLNTTHEQTRAIKLRQARAACLGQKIEIDQQIKAAISKLERVSVVVPFAEELVDAFPDSLIMRTHFARLIDYIKASAALHQHQRERVEVLPKIVFDGKGGYEDGVLQPEPGLKVIQRKSNTIIATTDDYENARIVLQATTSNQQMVPLTRKRKQLLEVCKELGVFCVRELQPKVPFLVKSKVYEALYELQELGFISSFNKIDSSTGKDAQHFEYIVQSGMIIPSWELISKNQYTKYIPDSPNSPNSPEKTPVVFSEMQEKGNYGTNGNIGNEGKEGNNKTPTFPVEEQLVETNEELILAFIKARQNDQEPNGTLIQKALEQLGESWSLIENLRSQGQIFEARSDHWRVLE